MKRIKISLASSLELKADRVAFEVFIGRRNKAGQSKSVEYELFIWEDFLEALSPIGLQQEYNQVIGNCDIFVMLYWSKVGPYTTQEFETAYQSFRERSRPFIYTYFKEAPHDNASATDHDSVQAFQQKLLDLGHFPSKYHNTEGLLLQFGQQLDRLEMGGSWGDMIAHPSTDQQREQLTYQLGNIMRLLSQAFTPAEFEKFTMEEYPSVHGDFTLGTLQSQRIQLLTSHCKTKGLLSELLIKVGAHNPFQFAQLGPYYNRP